MVDAAVGELLRDLEQHPRKVVRTPHPILGIDTEYAMNAAYPSVLQLSSQRQTTVVHLAPMYRAGVLPTKVTEPLARILCNKDILKVGQDVKHELKAVEAQLKVPVSAIAPVAASRCGTRCPNRAW